jgi:hypothetical protein
MHWARDTGNSGLLPRDEVRYTEPLFLQHPAIIILIRKFLKRNDLRTNLSHLAFENGDARTDYAPESPNRVQRRKGRQEARFQGFSGTERETGLDWEEPPFAP